uniref:Uncharacterized protein n=1 Tax=Arundo donax TaxID=35708 RepID=A0A0A9F618_ARUDO
MYYTCALLKFEPKHVITLKWYSCSGINGKRYISAQFKIKSIDSIISSKSEIFNLPDTLVYDCFLSCFFTEPVPKGMVPVPLITLLDIIRNICNLKI